MRRFFRKWSVRPSKRKPQDREEARQRVRDGIYTDQGGRPGGIVGRDDSDDREDVF